jgi:hypothetical protein
VEKLPKNIKIGFEHCNEENEVQKGLGILMKAPRRKWENIFLNEHVATASATKFHLWQSN